MFMFYVHEQHVKLGLAGSVVAAAPTILCKAQERCSREGTKGRRKEGRKEGMKACYKGGSKLNEQC